MSMRLSRLLLPILLAAATLPAHASDPVRVTPDVRSPLATTASIIERQFGPLDAFQIGRRLRSAGVSDTLDAGIASSPLLVRVPAKPAADGRYGLLVFLGDNQQARFDSGWGNALDGHGVIFVSPDNAGDEASVLEQRMPLALQAYEYARKHYDIDPARVYVAGAGGGARIAQRLALSYPDVFSGAIANAGAAELGTEAPAPDPTLLQLLRTRSTLVFATSRHDEPAFTQQRVALKSLHAYCIASTPEFDNGHTIAGHAGINGLFLNDFLRAFETPRRPDGTAQADCEQAFQRNAVASLAAIRQLQASGRRQEALKALVTFDHAYGRLFADDELALAKAINPAFFDGAAGAAATPESH